LPTIRPVLYVILRLLSLLDRYGQSSGLICNVDKTLARWLGSNTGLPPGDLPVKWTEDIFDILGITFSDNWGRMSEINYFNKVKNMNNLFRIWKMRDLSIIGKIMITKSLGISKLLYVASMLYTGEETLAEVQTHINDFVWNSKPPKVKMDTLIKQIPQGGLKLVDFRTQVKALVLNWIGRFFNNSRAKWAATFNAYFPDFEVEDLLKSRCSWEGLERLHLPPFYKQMLGYWQEIRSYSSTNTNMQVREEFLWFNNHITIDGKSVFLKEWYKKGIKYVQDLLKDDGSFMSHAELGHKYGVRINFLQCYQIRAAIPYAWKRMLSVLSTNEWSPKIEFNLDENTSKTIQNMTCKDFYWFLISKKHPTVPTAELRWAEELDIQHNWEDIYRLPLLCTMETKLRARQYSILHRYVPHKKLLFRQRLVPEEICNSCPEQESILHRFWSCPTTHRFWMLIEQWLRGCMDIDLNFTCHDIIFGIPMVELDDMKYALNNVILNAKLFVHSRKCQDAPLGFESFKKHLHAKILIEKDILTSKGKEQIFRNRWSDILQSF
jgi:hypothetical protein